ncbi:hypothetical protein M3172_19360 [Mesobacillus subterraneus]|uniref:hypothetical protein n=1 Tax=Mesobacillus subterraneus TaxID=285983 RepID=UPI00203C3315|nr:hypothetical protein [Mesobacillus subterraneus]MCM3575362.1 hypothetical protein [Mesobacillus subterraneus]
MGQMQKKLLKERRELILMILVLGLAAYYILFFTPKDSLELYQAISFADDFEEAQKVMLEGYEGNFKEEDFEFINRLDTSADRISQFTLFEYDEKTYLVMTTPGTERLKVLAVEELPEEIREYFLEIAP